MAESRMKGEMMKKVIFSGLIFLVLCIGLNAQTLTVEGDENFDYEYTIITKQQFERIVRAGETTAVGVLLTFIDNITMTGGKIIQGKPPNLDGYYYAFARMLPKNAMAKNAASYIISMVVYGNTNTGEMRLIFMRTAGVPSSIYLTYDRDEYVRQFNQLLELVNGE